MAEPPESVAGPLGRMHPGRASSKGRGHMRWTDGWLSAFDRPARALRGWASTHLSAIDAVPFVVGSWWLAIVAIWVLQEAHAGLHERHELPLLLHLLRDGALAVPSAAVAIGVAALIVGGRRRSPDQGSNAPVGDVRRFWWAFIAAALFALLSVPGHELHGSLFGAEQQDIGWLAHATLDGAIAFIGALIALLPVAVVVGPPLRSRELSTNPSETPRSGGYDPATVVPARSTR